MGLIPASRPRPASMASASVLKMAVSSRRFPSSLLLRRADRKTEGDGFPSVLVLLLVKAWPDQVKRGVGSGGSARPRLAAAMVVDWIFRD